MVSHTTRLVCYAIPLCPGPSHPDTKRARRSQDKVVAHWLSVHPCSVYRCRISSAVYENGARRAGAIGVPLLSVATVHHDGYLVDGGQPQQHSTGHAVRQEDDGRHASRVGPACLRPLRGAQADARLSRTRRDGGAGLLRVGVRVRAGVEVRVRVRVRVRVCRLERRPTSRTLSP
eukprot:scaffold23815_cov55-Phaeocystis_antarctica.AAC.2